MTPGARAHAIQKILPRADPPDTIPFRGLVGETENHCSILKAVCVHQVVCGIRNVFEPPRLGCATDVPCEDRTRISNC